MEDMKKKLQYISSYTSTLLRKKFGRGPELCFASQGDQFIVIFIKGFITPLEETMLEQGEFNTAATSRRKVFSGLAPELVGVLQSSLEIEVIDVYFDWSYENNTGVVAFSYQSEQQHGDTYQNDALKEEVNRITNLVQKIPAKTELFKVSERIIVVIRNGILVPIEKALIDKGFHETLRITKSELEKTFFHHYGKFDETFDRPVTNIFFDWNLKQDKGFICFMIK